MNLISRAEAKYYGKIYYYTGKPCSKGHENTQRYTSTKSCVKCANEHMVIKGEERMISKYNNH